MGDATGLPCMQFCRGAIGGGLKVRFRSAGFLVLESKSRESHQVDREVGGGMQGRGKKTKSAEDGEV